MLVVDGHHNEVEIENDKRYHIQIAGSKCNYEFKGILDRIVKPGEKLKESEVRKYYGQNYRKAGTIEMLESSNAYRMIFKRGFLDYLIIPVNRYKYMYCVRSNVFVSEIKTLKNYEVVRNMSVDELAHFLNHTDCGICAYRGTSQCFSLNGMGTTTCTKGIKEWLNQDQKLEAD